MITGWRKWFIVSVLLAALLPFSPASAHANLIRSEPAANNVLETAPTEIRLWFTEPLEPAFSKITLRDAGGNVVPTPASAVDSADPLQMSLSPGSLPDGLYTVAWRVLSAADGHPTIGSFAFVIGEPPPGFGASGAVEEAIPLDGSLIRWANLFSFALCIGSLGFILFVWHPAVPESETIPAVEQRLKLAAWIGWGLMGFTGVLLLFLQYAQATGSPFLTGIEGDSLNNLVSHSRFGQLWQLRMFLWLGMLIFLDFRRDEFHRIFLWTALALGISAMLVNSLFSHASGARDTVISIAADALHLTAMALWVGGLCQFVSIIGPLRRSVTPAAPLLGLLVARFSNLARVSVAVLIVTGLYSSWLLVGSLEGLLTTPYGVALLVKIILIVPVMAIAAVNLFYTGRALAEGQEIWGSRLRRLVSAEIVLTIGVLAAVGVMTSISPARNTLDRRAANPPAPEPQPIAETLTANDLTLQLTFSPGRVGQNTFTLTIIGGDGQPVENATLIRMRFESQAQNLGESELRPEHQGSGVYAVSGANLSVPGEWRIRTTVQRPGEFDALADFRPDVPVAPPLPLAVPLPPSDALLPNRTLALLLAGILSLAVGGFFLGENRDRILRASTLLSGGLVILGMAFLLTAVRGSSASAVAPLSPVSNPVGFQLAPQTPVRLTIAESAALPYLVTAGGDLLAGENGVWRSLRPPAPARDAYADGQGALWAATDNGLYRYAESVWTQLDSAPVIRVELMHGYAFALGASGDVTRAPAGGGELDAVRQLRMPLPDQPATELVMLGNHNHVVDNGGQLYVTPDLGLSWLPVLGGPGNVQTIRVDLDGNLLVFTRDSILTWDYATQTWGRTLPLPGGDPNPAIRAFNEQLYAAAGGTLYRLAGAQWQPVTLAEPGETYFLALAYQFPDTLWALDVMGMRLWFTRNGASWRFTDIKIE